MRPFRLILAIFLLAVFSPAPARSDEFQDLVAQLGEAGRTPGAIPLAERLVVVVRTRFGANHPQNASALGLLSDLYQLDGRLQDAERAMRQALAVTTTAFGPLDSRVADDLLSLAVLVQQQSRLDEAEALSDQVIKIRDELFGSDDSRVVSGLEFGGLLAKLRGKYTKARRLYVRAADIVERRSGSNDPHLGRLLKGQASVAGALGDYDGAEGLLRRSTRILEMHPLLSDDLGDVLQELAALSFQRADYQHSKQLLIRTVALLEKTKGANHPDLAPPLKHLAQVYQAFDQDDLVEPLILRAVGLLATAPDHYQLLYAEALLRLAGHYSRSDRHQDARRTLLKALAITEAHLGSDHPDVALMLQALARAEQNIGHSSEAMSLLNRALIIRQKTQSAHHPDYIQVLQDLGTLSEKEGHHNEALVYLEKALAAATASNASAGPLDSLHLALGVTNMSLGNTQAALAHWKAAFKGPPPFSFFETESNKKPGIQRAAAGLFLVTAFLMAKKDSSIWPSLADDAFIAAQHRSSSLAGSALSKMAARAAARDPRLSKLVRRVQDLALAYAGAEQSLVTRLGRSPSDSNAAIRGQHDIAQVRRELDVLGQVITAEYPEYTAFAATTSLSIREVRGLLQADEVLLVLDASGLGTYGWAVSRDASLWYRVADKDTIQRLVRDLRCGLDYTLWQRAESADKCRMALSASPSAETVRTGNEGQHVQVLPFELGRAHELYKLLLGPLENLIQGKHLIIVPSGLLTSLPFHVLVAETPRVALPAKLADYRDAAWLGTRQPITVLPSVVSLKLLREHAKTSRATKPYLGIGNPLLEGPQEDPQWGAHYKKQALAAQDKQQCPTTLGQRISLVAGRPLAGFAKLFRGGHADIEEVRQWTPLPETADELCEVGRRLGVQESEILLGANATETNLKEFSEQDRLADYRILHFATHGAITGQVRGFAEPGLLLTPPPKGTNNADALDRDDGFLTSSEISTLRLDADWVILSACNTAGGVNENAEALSGIARAFFYAGARTLLVSHWEVGSDAAVKLTTRTFAELKRKPSIGRAEALRAAMRELIEKGSLSEAHPSIWAPFVVVGGAGR